jgi:hypothetical protein
VWSTYCGKNRDNARRVYEDAGRYVRGISDTFIKRGAATAQAADWVDRLATAKQDLSDRARLLDGIESLDGHYKQASEAAKECAIGEHFSLSYKILSKFAHPTAMRILALPDDKKEAFQRDWYSVRGVYSSRVHCTPWKGSCVRKLYDRRRMRFPRHLLFG